MAGTIKRLSEATKSSGRVTSTNAGSPKLCKFCSSIDLDLAFAEPDPGRKSGYPHHPSLLSLIVAADNGCELCHIFRLQIMTSHSDESVSPQERQVYLILWDFDSGEDYSQGANLLQIVRYRNRETDHCMQMSLYVPDGSILADARIVSGRIVSRYATFDASRKWMLDRFHECVSGHKTACSLDSTPTLPTRVIDVGPPKSSQEPRLYITKHEKTQWVALSHCWGTKVRFVTDSTNIEDRKRCIALESLPPTFQDAVKVARMLACRYLWIDSLCIIQDSVEDWVAESSKMNQYYKGALVTIAVESSQGDHEGFLHYDRSRQDLEIPTLCGTIKEPAFIRPPFSHHGFVGRETPLSMRGWTLQEKIMSPRIIHFTDNEIVWECQTETFVESCRTPRKPTKERRRFSTCQAGIDYESSLTPWQYLAADFVQRLLTNESDKLVAISALAREFHQRTHWTYLAGLWKENIASDLAWSIESDCKPQPKYIAPSWSWASLRPPLDSHAPRMHGLYHTLHNTEGVVSEVELRGFQIVPATADPFGAVRSGNITLRGSWLAEYPQDQAGVPHLNTSWAPYRSHWYASTQSTELSEAEYPRTVNQWICSFDSHPQELENWEWAFKDVSFLRILKWYWSAYPVFGAIMLTPEENRDGFRRVGLAEIPDCFETYKLAWQVKDIKIV